MALSIIDAFIVGRRMIATRGGEGHAAAIAKISEVAVGMREYEAGNILLCKNKFTSL